MSIQRFGDTAVLYHSAVDRCWVAHSLRTDQVGTGTDMGRALADLIRAVDGLLELADADATVAYLREAPLEIQARAARSQRLPAEIYEVAHKLARGRWPDSIEPHFDSSDDGAFVADLVEAG